MLTNNKLPRPGSKDLWNAFMLKGASFDPISDMPVCISSDIVPRSLISFDEAKSIYYREAKKKNTSFFIDSFIMFYIDDHKFDGKRTSIWTFPGKALKIIRHFSGIITPDFSTCADFPDSVNRFNTFRMRTFGVWMNQLNIPVINNVRWGTYDTWDYCFSGIPKGSPVAIGTVACGLRKSVHHPIFIEGFKKMLSVIDPPRIIIYGSSERVHLQEYCKPEVEIIVFPGKTSIALKEVTP